MFLHLGSLCLMPRWNANGRSNTDTDTSENERARGILQLVCTIRPSKLVLVLIITGQVDNASSKDIGRVYSWDGGEVSSE